MKIEVNDSICFVYNLIQFLLFFTRLKYSQIKEFLKERNRKIQ